MSMVSRIRINIADARTFGPRFLTRHLGRLSQDAMRSVSVPGVGAVTVRAGESDVAAVRQVFADRDYDLAWPSQHVVWPREVAERIGARYEAILAAGGKPVIVDAGANIGAASLWFGAHYPKAHIVAVEPDPGNAAVLKRNIGHRPRHTVLEAAIGAEPGNVSMSAAHFSWAVQTTRADQGLPIVTIDDACTASGGDTLFIVKVDIEGFESDLFGSNIGWLEHAQVVFIEPHDWMLPGKSSSGAFQRAMAQHPFELFIRGENLIYVRN